LVRHVNRPPVGILLRNSNAGRSKRVPVQKALWCDFSDLALLSHSLLFLTFEQLM
jgi:hypothetical protein